MYRTKIVAKIEDIKAKLDKSVDKLETLRLKNMLSAYSCRLQKREEVEELKEELDLRNELVSRVLRVCQQQLPTDQLVDVLRHMKEQTPTMSSTMKNLTR